MGLSTGDYGSGGDAFIGPPASVAVPPTQYNPSIQPPLTGLSDMLGGVKSTATSSYGGSAGNASFQQNPEDSVMNPGQGNDAMNVGGDVAKHVEHIGGFGSFMQKNALPLTMIAAMMAMSAGKKRGGGGASLAMTLPMIYGMYQQQQRASQAPADQAGAPQPTATA